MIKPGHAKVPDENIGMAIVVIITDGDAHAPSLVRHAGFVRHVFKFPITEVAIESGARRLLFSLHCRQGRSVQKINVGQPVAVIVENRYAT